MTDRNFAERFAREWAQAWNDKDIEAILRHYSDDVVFHSPRIALLLGSDKPSVEGKDALRAYWAAALEKSPALYFEVDRVFVGADALTILYTNHRDETVAETFVFNTARRVRLSAATYS